MTLVAARRWGGRRRAACLPAFLRACVSVCLSASVTSLSPVSPSPPSWSLGVSHPRLLLAASLPDRAPVPTDTLYWTTVW